MTRDALALTAAILATGLIVAAPVLSTDSAALPAEQVQGNISFVTGGVGEDEAAALKRAAARYPLQLQFVQKNAGRNVAGTVIGGIIGGLIGHQIGSGTGQTAATIAGAVGGAVAGNQIEKRSRGANETFRVTVRLDNGGYHTVTQDNITDLRTGDRVRVDGNMVYRY